MSDNVTPEGRHTVTPRIVAADAKGLVRFVKDVFGANGDYREEAPSETITEAGFPRPMPAFLYVYVADADAAYRRALDSGAQSIEAPVDTPYGDHRCMIEDRWGNTWQIATPIR